VRAPPASRRSQTFAAEPSQPSCKRPHPTVWGKAPLFKTADVCDNRCIELDITSMSSRAPDMLSSIFSTGRPPAAPAFSRGMIPMKMRAPAEVPDLAGRSHARYVLSEGMVAR
jgi:hypothetical protein